MSLVILVSPPVRIWSFELGVSFVCYLYRYPPDLDSLQLLHNLLEGEVVERRDRARVIPHYPTRRLIKFLGVEHNLFIDLLLLQPRV